MIDCVSISTSKCFDNDLIVAQHQLRYKEVVQKESWRDIYTVDGMEFDQYDNLATEYFVARNEEGDVVGVTRSYPTTIPYMLTDIFSYLFSDDLPSSPQVFEASRLVLDRSKLSKKERRPVVDMLMLAYMERGLQRGIDSYIGFMLPKIWSSTYLRVGWDVKWAGPEFKLPKSDDVVRAALMPVNEELYHEMRRRTGIHHSVLNFGRDCFADRDSIAQYSHENDYIENEIRKVA